MKIGIVREGKIPPDERVPLTPHQCKILLKQYPNLDILVQPSKIRAFSDESYRNQGIAVQEDLTACEVLMGVKEVNLDDLIPDKTYFFFSHTFKKQPYNRKLLQTILARRIRLIDYELLTDSKGDRLVAFGYYAGIVGAYNGLRGWGIRNEGYELKPAHECYDKFELEGQLHWVRFKKPVKILVTGKGRVASGAVEILEKAGIEKVTVDRFLHSNPTYSVFSQIGVEDYNIRSKDRGFDQAEFYKYPDRYESNFNRFSRLTDLLITGHYWDSKAPFLFSREEAKHPQFKIKMVADISCDIDGPVASTIRPSTIAAPYYGYSPVEEKETDFMDLSAIGVMAVDNLPCELPRDASNHFGNALIKKVIPALFNQDKEAILYRASQTDLHGKLMPKYTYLQDYVGVI
jgi:saccharopine dehydrogenase (NAD+, L-lysine-forming)